ncbi:MAG: sialidase family protein [Planctomycetota bacterium]
MRPLALVKSPLVPVALALALGPGTLAAQDPIVHNSNTTDLVRSTLSHRKGITATSDGRLWAVSYNDDKKTGDADKDRHMFLSVSTDGGASWTQVTEARTTGETYGSLVTGPDGRTLHIVWNATNGVLSGTTYCQGVYYGTYDTVKNAWNGTADVAIQPGKDANAQYHDPDIAVSPEGYVMIAYNSRYTTPPNATGGSGSWNGYLVWDKGKGFSVPNRVNVDTYGIGNNIHWSPWDSLLHMSYRINTGGYGTAYRTFDVYGEKFGPEIKLPPPTGTTVLTHANRNHLAVAVNGDIWVMYIRNNAAATPQVSEIRVAYLKAGATSFSADYLIDSDTYGQGGNNSSYNYSLSTAPGGKVFAIWSLKSETYNQLYMRPCLPTGVGPKVTMRANGRTSQFAWVTGYRPTLQGGGLHALLSDQSTIGPLTGGRSAYLSPISGVFVLHGAGCDGTSTDAPILGADTDPALGQTLNLLALSHPAKTAAVLLLGVNDAMFGPIPLPLALDPLGMPGCRAFQDLILSLAYQVDAQGVANLPLPIPNDKSLAGLPLYFQSFVIAVGANKGNAVMTNGLAAIAR